MTNLEQAVLGKIRDIPDFPNPGVLFKDITPVLARPDLMAGIGDWMATTFGDIDLVMGMESRGFIFGTPLAERLKAGFVPARKKGKLPHTKHSVDYELEYGTATLEIHTDAIREGQRVLICDDLLATGGTAAAAIQLVERSGGIVAGCTFLIELKFLNGRKCLNAPVKSLIQY